MARWTIRGHCESIVNCEAKYRVLYRIRSLAALIWIAFTSSIHSYVRLEQSRSQPGSGLGLSLAAAVARRHGGELTLEDNRPGLKSVIALPRGGPLQSAG